MIDYKEQMNDPRWVERSREVMKSDNFTCQLCGKSHTKLNVHHIRYIKGKDYWDYPDELLMTVCETCHAKIHGKYDKSMNFPLLKKEDFNANIKRPYYRAIIGNYKNLTPNEKILYSFLVSKSILQIDSIKQGNKIPKDNLLRYLKINNNRINLAEFTYKQLSKELNMSFQSAMNGIKTLNDSGFIIKSKIFAPPELVEKGYFEIPEISNLKGLSLIFLFFFKR